MNNSLYIDLSKATKVKVPQKPAGTPPPGPPSKGSGMSFSGDKTSAPGPSKTFNVNAMKQAAGTKYDYAPSIPQGSQRPWEATGSGGYKAPEGTRGMDSKAGAGPSGAPGKPGPSVEDRKTGGDPIKTPQGLSSKQSILSSDSKDFKDHSVTDHYKIMNEVGHDDKLSAMHQKHIQDKTKNFTSDDHAKLAGELRDAHEKSPNPRIEMAAEFHEESAERTKETKESGTTSASSDKKKMDRDAAAKKTKEDARDKKIKSNEAKQKSKVKAEGKSAEKKRKGDKKKADKTVKDRESKAKASENKKADTAAEKEAEKKRKEKEKEDSPEMKRVKSADHSARAKKLHENVSSHLDGGELDPETHGRLKHIQDLAGKHSDLPEVSPKHSKELKEAEGLAGDHGSGSFDEHAEAAEKNKPDPQVEAAKHAAHKQKVQDLKDNIDAHLESEDISDHQKEKLEKIKAALEGHGDSPPTPEQEKQIKELEKAAGAEGKPPKEPKGPGAGSGGKTSSGSSGFSGSGARALGARLGSASASEDNAGDIAGATTDYALDGAVSAGHHLLNSGGRGDPVEEKPKPKKKPAPKEDTQESTKKSVRLFVAEGK